MNVKMRNFIDEDGYCDDFQKICDFLIRINQNEVVAPNWLWARWVWQYDSHINTTQSHFGIAEVNGKIVGLTLYDHGLGDAFFCADMDYEGIKSQLIDFAIDNLNLNGEIRLALPDGDSGYQQSAVQKGFISTTEKIPTSRIDINDNVYTLPKGYTIMSFADKSYDADKYFDAIWKGFENKCERTEAEMEGAKNREGFDKPYFDPDLRILVVSPNGDYAAHCGMWCIPGSKYAYVEPVFTLPEYRKLGLGKAAVLEGINRCGKLGAKHAYVLSSQQFYYNIGFYPYKSDIWWVHKKS
ncbi:MAG: GCN5-related N-acetyltransferase [Herbinix sp.]|nr:GCN5-related N-acetyltransferase [Herbinix sp.]